jgi:hypothetical protein
MKRNLLLALVAACLCAACAAPRDAGTNVLVSNVLSQRSANGLCAGGKVQWCEVDVDDSKQCRCIQHHQLFGHH